MPLSQIQQMKQQKSK